MEVLRKQYCKLGKRLEILRHEIDLLCPTREAIKENAEEIRKRQKEMNEIGEEMQSIEKVLI